MTKTLLPAAAFAGALVATLAAPSFAQTTPVTPRTIIVMDGSGSMWGQIGGVPKLEIARQVVGEVLAGMAPDATLGLIAYGHRRRGDCSDIELMVEPAPGSAGMISQAVNTMRFQGRTPLTDSVRRAAEVLRWSEDPATVVLVTDGIETCEADPCALGRELEASGVDFTAHVVGFGLSAEEGAQVACLAQETGGRYFQADDAAALTGALTQTLAAPEPALEPAPEPAVLEVVPPAGPWYPGPAYHDGLHLQPTGRSRGLDTALPAEISFPADGTPAMCQALCADDTLCAAWQFYPRGSYFIEEARCTLFNADAEFDYAFDTGFVAGTNPEEPQLTRPFEAPLPAAALEAPASVPALSTITVTLSGPMGVQDFLDIVEEGATRTHAAQSSAMIAGAAQVTIVAPAAPGRYSLRYVEEVEGLGRRVLASQPLEVTELSYALRAPSTAMAGDTLQVGWMGPAGAGDYVDVIEEGETRTNSAPADAELSAGNPTAMVLPLTPGAYRLRYIVEGPEGRVVALSQPLTLSPATGSLVAPETVAPGAGFAVDWQGPASARHWIDIVTPGHEGYAGELTYAYLDPASRQVALVAPEAAGDYVLRYVIEDMRGNRHVLATRALRVGGGVAAPGASK